MKRSLLVFFLCVFYAMSHASQISPIARESLSTKYCPRPTILKAKQLNQSFNRSTRPLRPRDNNSVTIKLTSLSWISLFRYYQLAHSIVTTLYHNNNNNLQQSTSPVHHSQQSNPINNTCLPCITRCLDTHVAPVSTTPSLTAIRHFRQQLLLKDKPSPWKTCPT